MRYQILEWHQLNFHGNSFMGGMIAALHKTKIMLITMSYFMFLQGGNQDPLFEWGLTLYIQYVDKWQIEAKNSKQSPAIQAVMKQETLPAIRALRPQLEMSVRLPGAMAAGKRTTILFTAMESSTAFHSLIQYAIYCMCVQHIIMFYIKKRRNNKLKVTINLPELHIKMVEFYGKMINDETPFKS